MTHLGPSSYSDEVSVSRAEGIDSKYEEANVYEHLASSADEHHLDD